MSSIRLKDITKHPCHRPILGSPGKKLKRGRIRHGDHIALFDAGKAFNRGAVKPHALGQSPFQFRWRDGKGFQNAQNVGEPDLDEADVTILNDSESILF